MIKLCSNFSLLLCEFCMFDWQFCECNWSITWVQFPHGIRPFVHHFISFQIFIAGLTSLTGSAFYWLKGTWAEIWTNLKGSSWLHSNSSNGKLIWRYCWERKVSKGLPYLLRQGPMQQQKNQMAQQEGWGLWYFVSEYFERPPLSDWFIDIS